MTPWKSKTKQRMVFRMIYVKNSRSYHWAKFGRLGLPGSTSKLSGNLTWPWNLPGGDIIVAKSRFKLRFSQPQDVHNARLVVEPTRKKRCASVKLDSILSNKWRDKNKTTINHWSVHHLKRHVILGFVRSRAGILLISWVRLNRSVRSKNYLDVPGRKWSDLNGERINGFFHHLI